MNFIPLAIKDAFLIECVEHNDNRGFFAREFCKKELYTMGITFNVCQMNISYNEKKGTIRGMHYQKEPYEEQKIVFCSKGSLCDVILDLRKNSETYLHSIQYTLTEKKNAMLFIPKGCAHGFQTVEDNTILHYILDEYYYKEYYTGVRYNDPAFSIEFPIKENITISNKDATYSNITL